MSLSRERIFIILKALSAIAISAIVISFPFYSFESFLYDLRFKLNPISAKSKNIEAVAIDTTTIQILNGEPTLEQHVRFLEKIKKDNPLAVYYVIDPTTIIGGANSKSNFAKSLKEFKNYFIYKKEIPNKGEESKLLLGKEYIDLKYTPGFLSTDFQHFSEDNVARRAVLEYDGYVYTQVQAANLLNPASDFYSYRGAFNFKGTPQIYVNYQPTGTYTAHSMIDVLQEKTIKGSFKDKIVIIGYDRQNDFKEYVKTVYNNNSFAMPEYEAHANVIATLIQNNGIVRTPNWLNAIITMLFSLIVAFSVFSLKPTRGLALTASIFASYSLLSWALFSFTGIAIGMAQPLIAIFVCYYLFIPYRLITENKKYWELTQKNKLLTQVEELKNNFLSLMSHDLKTPLARIQGMADVALSNKENLDTNQQTAIRTIKQSADELTEFITNILDLSRVESQKIKLNLQSKDINTLLDEVIKKYEFLALQKNIEIVREYEPLFSVKVDTDLMRQVFSNLVENAIKYSPANSKILVTTDEEDGHIIVQVADQGIGITETEIKNIFTKFYRTKNVKNSQIKGSGLGLYLAKYFVELHKGDISVESLPRQGSTFTVNIPMDH